MRNLLYFLTFLSVMVSCHLSKDNDNRQEKCKAEIIQTEKDFEKMAAEKGLPEAFSHYAADSAILNVRDSIIHGKPGIKNYYQSWTVSNVSLRWSPDFVDVSSSCDLGYTYGKYTFSFTDSTGRVLKSKGIFHTVWKKQPDGTWRFVWD